MNGFNRRLAGLLVLTALATPTLAANMVIFGASGQFGQELVREALSRGHHVYGVSRTPEKFTVKDKNFTPVKGDPTQIESVRELSRSADAILVALGDRETAEPEKTAMNLAAIALTAALADRGKSGPPVIVLGGGNTAADSEAGMLEILATRGAERNPRMKQIYLSQWATYQTYRKSSINWTYVATPLNILGASNSSGQGDASRTGKYRAAADGSLDKEPNTGLSRADIAVAMVDFAESGRYSQKRVLVVQEKPNH